MIRVQALRKNYGDIQALDDVSFVAEAGEVVGFLGPNGAGKTTTMRILTTFLPASSGEAEVAGFDVFRQAEEVRKRIGYLPETPPLYPELTANEYLTFVGKIKGLTGRALRERLEVILETCGLTHVRHRVCGQLSKGYKQRVGLAQALLHNPQVIILDEPTSGLDPEQILEIRKLIHNLRKNHTVLLSTHILSEVKEICSRVVVIAQGRTRFSGLLEDLTREKTLEQAFLDAVSNPNAEISKEARV